MKKLLTKQNLVALAVILLLTNAITLAWWRPWQPSKGSDRKITVTGEATVKGEPDEYQFNPYYERKTVAELTTLSSDITKKLNIKTEYDFCDIVF